MILDASKLDASDPARISWSTGLTYRKDNQPRFLARLEAGEEPQGIGAGEVSFGGSELRGLTVRGDRLFGLVLNGSNLDIESVPAPPVGGNVSVNSTLSLPLSAGNFSQLHSGSSVTNTLLSTDGAGNYLTVWLEGTASYDIVSGPLLRDVKLDLMGNRLCGINTLGEVTLCNLTWDGGARSLLISPELVVSGSNCSSPSLSPDGNFLVFKDGAGATTLLNLNNSENTPLNVTNVREMIWGHR